MASSATVGIPLHKQKLSKFICVRHENQEHVSMSLEYMQGALS